MDDKRAKAILMIHNLEAEIVDLLTESGGEGTLAITKLEESARWMRKAVIESRWTR